MSNPKYSIITIACNGIENTIKCVNSVLEFSSDFELIIVDSNTTDGTRGYLNEVASKNKSIKLIEHNNKLSFSENNNLGIQIAKGDYIVFLNNDTIVTPHWLERMEEHFFNVPISNIGCVGPVSSFSNGRQMVGLQDSEEWYKRYRGSWAHAGILYGWCMMFKREVIEKIGGFDERFENSYEDNDLCLRTQLAGYSLVIAKDVYIYHKGSATIKTVMDMDAYVKNGAVNRERYYDKYKDQAPKKLIAVYRTNGGSWLERSLEQTSKFADSIIIHFCRARENMPKERYENLLIKFPKVIKTEFYDGIFQEDYERNWLLQEALKLNAQGKADWCISIDDDEIYEDKFIEISKRLMTPRNPEIFGYWCNWRTIWDKRCGVEYYRTDSTFGSFTNYRFFKLIQGQEIKSNHPEGHHCGSAPWFAEENLQWTNIRVKHMGYDTPEQRQKKFEFYQANDNFKRKADIGYDDYSHLISKNPILEKYEEDNGTSLVMMVKNEEDLIIGMLENIHYLVDEIIIVDTGSTDNTLKLLYEFRYHSHIPIQIIEISKMEWFSKYLDSTGRLINYSIPRNYGRSFATKKWILFLDADERIRPEHIREVMKYTETEADVVKFNVMNYLGHGTLDNPPPTSLTQAARLFRNIDELFFCSLIHENIDDSFSLLSQKRKMSVIDADVVIHHYGYLKPKDKVKVKLDLYEKLNLRQVDITEGKDPRPFFNLALHYVNDDKMTDALNAFQSSLSINPRFWLTHQQMAALNMQNVKKYLEEMLKYMPVDHPLRPQSEEILSFINSKCRGFVKVGK